MKLKLKQLAAYLPYGLRLTNCAKPMNGRMCELLSKYDYNTMKPILQPLSLDELMKVVLTDMGECTILDYIATSKKDSQLNARLLLDGKYDQLEYWKIERLVALHLDVFKLIPAGLAIDINTLKGGVNDEA